MQKLIEQAANNGLLLAIKDQPTTKESLGCLTALFVVTFLPLIGYVVFTLWSNTYMDGGVIVIGGVIALAGLTLLARRTPVRMEIRSDQDRWTTTVAGSQSIWPSTRSFRLSDIHRIEVERKNWSKAGETKKQSSEPKAVFEMSLVDAAGKDLACWEMDLEGVRDSTQILEFLLRVAKITGLAGYRVNRSDSRQLEAAACREPDTDLTPIDTTVSDATGAEAAATTVVPPFEPENIPRWLDFDAVEWQPGRRVHLGKLLRARTFLKMSLSATALVVSLMILNWPALLDLLGLTYMKGIVLFAVILSGALLLIAIVDFYFFDYPRWRTWKWVIDWHSRNICVTRGKRRKDIPFDRLTGIGLRGCWFKITTTTTRDSGGGNIRTQSVRYRYSFEVLLFVKSMLSEESVLALQSRSSTFLDASTDGYQCMLSLVADLSAALDVPYRYEDFRERSEYPKYDWE